MTRQLRSNPEQSSFLHRNLSRSTWATRGLAGLCAAALLVSACGSESATSSSGEGGETDLATAMLGMTEEEFHNRSEQEVQKCMTAKGWEYETTSFQSVSAMGVGSTSDPGEYARENGYGIFGAPDGAMGAVAVAGGDDPNQKYIQSLSTADQEAYYADLFGAPDQESTDGAVAMGGCMNEATEKVAGPGGMEAMSARFEQLNELIQADSEVVEATKAWSTCMADAGYAYSKPEDALNEFFERSQSVDFNDQAALDAARTEEIAVATADVDCQESAGLTEANEAALQRAVEQLETN